MSSGICRKIMLQIRHSVFSAKPSIRSFLLNADFVVSSIAQWHCTRLFTSLVNDLGLTLVSAPHLARSYHHLFPLPVFAEKQIDQPRYENI